MIAERCLADLTLVDDALHQRVVVGDHLEPVVAEEVAAGVADVRETEPFPDPKQRGQRRAHALERGVARDHLAEGVVGLLHRGLQRRRQLVVGWPLVERGDVLDDEPARHLAGRVAAHPVGDREQARPGVHRVLVAVAEQADVAARAEAQGQRHERSSSTVLPIRMGTPGLTGVAALSRWRSR